MRHALLNLSLAVLVLAAGCAQRPRGVTEPDQPSEAPIARSTTLEVRAGDDWEAISSRIFGDGRHAARIAADNDFDPSVDPPAGTRVRVDVPVGDLELVRQVAEARGPYNAGVEAMNERGREVEAREAFELALERAPNFLDARYNLGLVLIRLGEPRDALAHLERVVAARPDDVDALYGYAAAHVHRGDDASAIEPLERAIAIDPTFLRARWTYALALQRAGRVDDAAAAWQRYLEFDSTSALADEARAHLRSLRPGR